jgi:hypothetical protein
MLDSMDAAFAASRLASSATPPLTVHWIVPEPSRSTTKAIFPAVRCRWTQPRRRTTCPVFRPARMSATESQRDSVALGVVVVGIDVGHGHVR